MPAIWSQSSGMLSVAAKVVASTPDVSRLGQAYADTAICANRIAAISSRLKSLRNVLFIGRSNQKINELEFTLEHEVHEFPCRDRPFPNELVRRILSTKGENHLQPA